MLILLVCLILNCQTTIKVEPVLLPLPVPPNNPGVEFSNVSEFKKELPEEFKDLIPEGLYLSYEDGRKLLIYLSDVDEYKSKLLILLEDYNGKPSE